MVQGDKYIHSSIQAAVIKRQSPVTTATEKTGVKGHLEINTTDIRAAHIKHEKQEPLKQPQNKANKQTKFKHRKGSK